MAVYRQIYLTFWQDEFVLSLTPEEKYFYLYLLTNSKTNLCGIYELPIKVIEFETGYNRETVEKLLAKFECYQKVHRSLTTNEIVIHNWLKYNSTRSPKFQSALNKCFEEVKDKSLIRYAYGIDTVSTVTVTETVTDTVTETETETEKSVKPIKQNKHRYGEYKNVLLTDGELEKLKTEYSNLTELIKFLDEYIEMKGYKAKSHYLAIKKWVVSAVEEQKMRNNKQGKNKSEKPSYDLDDIFKKSFKTVKQNE